MKIQKSLAAILLLLCAACAKDNTPGRIELLLEPMGGTKLVADTDLTAVWSNHDAIRINGTVATITRESDGRAYITATTSETNRALFPATLATAGPTVDNITVTLPDVYQYALEESHQKIDFPLAARSTGTDPLRFQHLTGALCFTIKNNRSETLTVDRITVASNNYRLNGDFSVNLNSIGSIAPQTTDNTSERQVTMYFDQETITIPAGESAKVLLPVAPVGSDNRFTVTVSTHHDNKRFLYNKTQTTGGSLARNELGYATVAIDNSIYSTDLFDGNGSSSSNPFLINSVSDFLLMVQAINSQWSSPVSGNNYSNCHYRLTADLDLTGRTINPIKLGENKSFTATEDHVLKGLTIQSIKNDGYGYCSLFENAAGCTVSYIILKDLTLQHTGNLSNNLYLGGFFSKTTNISVNNCRVDGIILNVSGNISGTTYIGGVAASISGVNSLSNCSANLSPTLVLTADGLNFGGLVGHCEKGTASSPSLTVTNCKDTLTANITSSAKLSYGGLIGFLTTTTATLTDCAYHGNDALHATGLINAGGLIGNYTKSSGSLKIENCAVSGTIHTFTNNTITTGPYVGKQNGAFSVNSCTNNLNFITNQ